MTTATFIFPYVSYEPLIPRIHYIMWSLPPYILLVGQLVDITSLLICCPSTIPAISSLMPVDVLSIKREHNNTVIPAKGQQRNVIKIQQKKKQKHRINNVPSTNANPRSPVYEAKTQLIRSKNKWFRLLFRHFLCIFIIYARTAPKTTRKQKRNQQAATSSTGKHVKQAVLNYPFLRFAFEIFYSYDDHFLMAQVQAMDCLE